LRIMYARRLHGACLACAWRVHGVCMACGVACAWRVHGVCTALAARGHGLVQRAWYPLVSPVAMTSLRSRSRTIGSAASHLGGRQCL